MRRKRLVVGWKGNKTLREVLEKAGYTTTPATQTNMCVVGPRCSSTRSRSNSVVRSQFQDASEEEIPQEICGCLRRYSGSSKRLFPSKSQSSGNA
jgi:hypothetical protein